MYVGFVVGTRVGILVGGFSTTVVVTLEVVVAPAAAVAMARLFCKFESKVATSISACALFAAGCTTLRSTVVAGCFVIEASTFSNLP